MQQLAAALAVGLSAIGGAIGISMVGKSLLDGVARQPELLGTLRTNFFLVAGLVDAVPIIGVVVGFIILFTG